MCGHVSIYYKKTNIDKKIDIEKIVDLIDHRGPDHTGFYKHEKIEFGFKRLSIIDLGNGSQPMEKDNKVIVFNGEIYNHKELKNKLQEKGYKFNTNCDTEVLLSLYSDKGKECLKDLTGMFSFIVFDKDNESVFGARDHFGIKPLYYIEEDDFIAFSSEYKALLSLIEEIKIKYKSLQSYMSFQYVLPNDTMIDKIKVVPAGSFFTIKDNKLAFQKYHYFDLSVSKSVTNEDVKNVVIDSIKKHMIANVEVGTFLSGGIDSTIVAAIAGKLNPQIKTFSVGFGVDGYNELDVAKETASKLNLENIQITVNQEEYIKSLPKIMYYLDDPVADPSIIGIYFLSKEARKHVKVVLSGEGSDELFGGYNIYNEYSSIKHILNMPDFMKDTINKISLNMPEIKGKSFLYRATTPLCKRYIGNAKIFDNDEAKLILKNYDEEYRYDNLLGKIYEEAQNMKYDHVTTMQHVDLCTWLQGDILQKADKMSMAASIELRVPFLDKEVLEVASNLSLNQKIKKGGTKVLLREAFKDTVPDHIVNKRKLGFPTPIRVWLKEDLGLVVKETIEKANVDHLINKSYAYKLLDEHIQNKKDNSRKIWAIFSFCLWYEIFIEKKEIIY
ncbi:asparagine synthase (glutamine-hydrolyzing) [Terrisporobacter mayombei]|uniref:asparagine synthase (glutamine-hydrolyzing) n=1 Tax=Terrisporobacter mayombei TaxID=1541 RepID=A0ABY9Q510_9FIRM|nr:asparagine synthase (glutamine-hydrolyzing) [Terrisporobacter mayombei]MCC3868883.1 asparagine synthase (glutamine-hydrolyzing) [Terrisporobacter mayombei]WMT82982.1 Asparagine synthetase [glutamine-hydrolyzing] 1 [Terrisporobacter mayombei]